MAMSMALIGTDFIALLAALSVAVLVRYLLGGQYDLRFYLSLSPALFLFLVVFGMRGLYPAIGMHAASEFKSIAQATTTSFLFLGTFTFFLRDAEAYSRIAMVLGWALSIPLVVSARALTRALFRGSSWWGEPAIVIGCTADAIDMAEILQRDGRNGLRVEGYVQMDSGPTLVASSSIALLGSLDELAWVAQVRQIEYGVFLQPRHMGSPSCDVIREIGQVVKRVLVVPVDLSGFSSLGAETRDIRGQLGIEITHRLLSLPATITKRCFDVVVSALLIALLSPVMLLVALMIAATSRGHVFYGQKRLGLDGAWFKAWKFRSMVLDADEILNQHLAKNEALATLWANDQKLRQDPRVTFVGRLLRKASLDELPQLWNVIRGEMSLVGPRPIVRSEIVKYGAAYGLYQRVRPGVTGLWQVSGRNNTTYAERVAYDEYYVRNWSLWLDLYILYQTIRVVILGEGAY
jgi:Undecaprenyl-phosphate galactose phosphotransferase WbaP